MKKVLSLVLALAIAVTCLVVINAAGNVYGAEWTLNSTGGNKCLISACGDGKNTPFKDVPESAFGTGNSLTFKLAVKNNTDQAISSISASYSWGIYQFESATSTTKLASNIGVAVDIPAGETKVFDFTLYKNVVYSNSTTNAASGASAGSNNEVIPWNKAGLRINFAGVTTADGTITLVSDNADVNKSLGNLTVSGIVKSVSALEVEDTDCEDAIALAKYTVPAGEIDWDKAQSTIERKKAGDTIYTHATGMYVADKGETKAWVSPYANIYDAVKAAMGTDDAVSVKVSFKVRADAVTAGTDCKARFLVRADLASGVEGMPDVKTASDAWNTWYKTQSTSKITADTAGNVFGMFTAAETISTSFVTMEKTLTFHKEDMNIFNAINVCFDNIANIKALDVTSVKVTKTTLEEEEEEQPSANPVGIEYALNTATTGETYIKTAGAVLSAADVAGGKLTKSYVIYNNGTVAVKAQLSFQTTHKTANLTDMWAPTFSEGYVLIPAGQAKTITYSVDVNAGQIEVTGGGNTQSYDLDKFFIRINIHNAEGATALTEGTKFIVACTGTDYAMFNAASITNKASMTIKSVTELPGYTVDGSEDAGEGEGQGEGAPEEDAKINEATVAWTKGYATVFNEVDANGYYSFKCVESDYDKATQHYKSAVAQLLPGLTSILGSDDSVTVKLSFVVKGTADTTAQTLIRVEKNSDVAGMPTFAKDADTAAKTAWADEWNAWYKKNTSDDAIITASKDGNIYGVLDKATKYGTDATKFEYTLNFTKKDVEYFKELKLCFDHLSNNETYVTAVKLERVATEQQAVKVPVGIKFILNEDVTAETYIKTGTGVVSASDVKNGTLTKSFKVINNGTSTIQVQLVLQAVHKTSENKDTWAPTPTDGYVTIEPGKSANISYEVEVDDGKVEITGGGNTAEYDLSKLFYRVNVRNGDGKINLAKGTAFTIACTDNDLSAFTAAQVNNKDKMTIETVYSVNASGTGDFAPVVFAAVVVVCAVALVVVSKKKKENEAA